jgi:hypothetical protein
MKKALKIEKVQRDEVVLNLVDETFSKLSCSIAGTGMYQELKKAIKEAYRLGRSKRKKLKDQRTIELISIGNAEARPMAT